MDHARSFHPASPLLARCERSLPAVYYYDPDRYREEMARIWAHSWVYAGRANDLPVMTLRRISIAGQSLILLKDQDGTIRCFHNTCRHRGSELCSIDERRLKTRLITCPYHQWGYALSGELMTMPNVVPTEDFDKAAHGLLPAHVAQWNGFVFVSLANDPPDFSSVPDLGPTVYDNWPMAELVTGHTSVSEVRCNWKIFWENYNECLHCPGIHPGLCDMVPIYRTGLMAHEEAADWTPEKPIPNGNLRSGARSWTMNGRPCGPEFAKLTSEERLAGYHFVTLLPSMFIVAHVDYVRAVSLRPVGPEVTEITAQWLFPRETLDASGFDLANVVDFASNVIREDATACEMNQRGLHCNKLEAGTLVPQEYAIFHFHEWVRNIMGENRS
jgi:Rieske 2Fe-2S family protein